MTGRDRFGAVRLVLATSASVAILAAAPLLAQAPPPVRPSVDGNGVDLFTGRLAVDGPALSIGSADQGLSYFKMYRDLGWTDNLVATISTVGSTVMVTFGGVSDSFTVNGSSYTATEGHGATLTLSGNIYTYTAGDGTIAHFSKMPTSSYPRYGAGARVTDITSPDGETLTFSYASVTYCADPSSSSAGSGCKFYTRTAYRLATVDNRYAYRATFNYAATQTDPMGGGFDIGTWSTPTGVTLLNRATNVSVTGTGYTNAAGQAASYGIGSDGITSITRPGSGSADVTIGYVSGRVSSVTTPAGTVSYVAAPDSGGVRTVTVTNPASQVTTYVFDIAKRRMTSVTDATNRTTVYTYDAAGRLTRTTMPEGNYVELTLDGQGNVTKTTAVAKGGSASIETSAQYPTSCTTFVTCNKPEWTKDANGNQTDYAYDPTHGGVLSVTAPAVGGVRPQTRYSYTPITNSVTGASVYQLTGTSTCRTTSSCVGTADETRTTIAYETGNLLPTSQTVAAGDNSLSATTSVTYDGIGNVSSVTDARGNTSNMAYNANRQMTGKSGPDPDGSGPLNRPAVDIFYRPDGQVGYVTEGRVDASWSFIVHRQLQFEYDAAHRKVRESLVTGAGTYWITDYSYDAAGRPECTAVRMNPSTWSSLTAACTLQTAAAHGPDRITRTLYDAAGRTTSVTSGYGTSVASADASYAYSLNGQVVSAIDAENNVTTNIYDGFDRLSMRQYPSSPKGSGTSNGYDHEEFGYDAAGNLTVKRNRDYRLVYLGYDALNRLTTKSVDQGCVAYQVGACPPSSATRSVNYGYDLEGRLTFARFDNASGEGVTLGYDALGRRVSETSTMGGNSRTVGSSYDIGGNRTRVSHPDGVYFDLFYDNLDRLGLANWYAPWVGGVQFMSISFDQQGRRQDINRASSYTGYNYDPASRLLDQDQRFANTAQNSATHFNYNPASQISDRIEYHDDYNYKGHYGVDRSYATNGLNQYTQAGPVSFAYDVNGNLQTSGSTTYGYDAENRLIASSDGAVLKYDPLGRLWQTDMGASTTRFLYDGDHVVAEYDGANVLQRRYMWGPGTDEPILLDEGSSMNCSGTRFAHTDERGSVVALASCFGNRTAVDAYDEYGVPDTTNAPVTAGGRFGYTGQMWIPELGLWYYKARMYSPTLGRFMQTDPVGYADGMNWYNYVGSDPVNRSDPSGLNFQYHYQNDGADNDIIVRGVRLGPVRVEFVGAGGNYTNFGGSGLGGLQETIGQDIVVTARQTGKTKSLGVPGAPQNMQPVMCPIAYTPNGDTKGENPQAQGDRYNTDLPGGYEAAFATFQGLTRLDAAQNGGNGGYHLEYDPRRATTIFRSNTGNIGLRLAFQNGSPVFRVDINANTFSLTKAETIHFNGRGRGNMCPTR